MAFSYDLSTDDADILRISKVRLELGDDTEDAGVRADGANYSDAEIRLKLAENNNNIMATVRALCFMLARNWTIAADVTVGPRRESFIGTAARWREMGEAIAASEGSGLLDAYIPEPDYDARQVRVWPD